MVKITKEAALSYHETGRPGKIEVKPTKPYHTQTDLSLAYSPGVACPCHIIAIALQFTYTVVCLGIELHTITHIAGSPLLLYKYIKHWRSNPNSKLLQFMIKIYKGKKSLK